MFAAYSKVDNTYIDDDVSKKKLIERLIEEYGKDWKQIITVVEIHTDN